MQSLFSRKRNRDNDDDIIENEKDNNNDFLMEEDEAIEDKIDIDDDDEIEIVTKKEDEDDNNTDDFNEDKENINFIFKHPRDKRIKRHPDPEIHGYFVDDKLVHISATGFKSFFFAPFEEEKVATDMVNRKNKNGVYWNPGNRHHGLTVLGILDLWEKSRTGGTTTHLCAEHYLNRGFKRISKSMISLSEEEQIEDFIRPFGNDGICCEDVRHRASSFLKVIAIFLEQGWKPYRTEWMVFHEYYDMAGSIDAVFYRDSPVKGGKRQHLIVDWKTVVEEKKVTEAFGNRKAYFPLEKFLSCRLTEYTVQLNWYKFVGTSKYDLEDVSMVVVCFFDDGNYKIYNIEDIHILECLKMYMDHLEVEKQALLWYKTGEDVSGFLPHNEPVSIDLLELEGEYEKDILFNEDDINNALNEESSE